MERHSRDTRDDGTVTVCTLRAATVLSRDCRADFGRRLTKKVMSHSRDSPGVTAPSRTNIVPLTGVWNPPSVTLPLRSPRSKQIYILLFLGFPGIRHFQALSAILREQNQTLSGKIRHFQAFSGACFCMICHDLTGFCMIRLGLKNQET